ncbi:MAG: lasso RiPP family leader peptide-containing protein [Erythrobacter sp.]
MNKPTKKSAYQKPQLTAFGSVRNLTGGSAGMMMDANGDMTAGMSMN